MNRLAPIPSFAQTPAIVQVAGAQASMRFWEFLVSNISNPNTRRAYAAMFMKSSHDASKIASAHRSQNAFSRESP
jgi:hypothetical protein